MDSAIIMCFVSGIMNIATGVGLLVNIDEEYRTLAKRVAFFNFGVAIFCFAAGAFVLIN